MGNSKRSIGRLLRHLRHLLKGRHRDDDARLELSFRVLPLERRRLPDASFALAAGLLTLDGFDSGDSLQVETTSLSPDVHQFTLTNGVWDVADVAVGLTLDPFMKVLTVDSAVAGPVTTISIDDLTNPLANVTDGAMGLHIATLNIDAPGGNVVLDAPATDLDNVDIQADSLILNDADGINIAGLQLTSSLMLTAGGNVTDSIGATIDVAGNGTLMSSGLITLGDSAGDTTHFDSVTFNGTNVSITEDSSLTVTGPSSATTFSLSGTPGGVSIDGGGNLTGQGSAQTSLTVASGGVLHVTGNVATTDFDLDPGSSLEIDDLSMFPSSGAVGAVSATAQVALDGNLTFDDSAVAASAGDQFLLVDNLGGSAVTGNFSGLLEGQLIDTGNNIFEISYVGGDGNDVVLTAVTTYDFTASTFTVAEADVDATDTVTVTITRDGDVSGASSVNVNLASLGLDTAIAGTDYTAGVMTVNFAASQTTAAVSVTVLGDNLVEGNETFSGTLAAVGANDRIGTVNQATITIADDDGASLSVNDITALENGAFVFTVTLDQAVAEDVTVVVNTADLPGQAVAGTDYTAISNQTLTFTSGGSLTQTVTVTVNNDTIVEADEQFQVLLSNAQIGGMPNPTVISISDAMGLGTIQNNDSAVLSFVSPTGVTMDEGDSGSTAFNFQVTLSAAVEGGLSLNWSTSDGTAVAPTDYASAATSVSFVGTANEVQTIVVNVSGDTTFETDETFSVVLGTITATNAGINSAMFLSHTGSPSTGTIVNDDTPLLARLVGGDLFVSDETIGGLDDTITISRSGTDVVVTSGVANLGNGTAAAAMSQNFSAASVTGTIFVNTNAGDDLLRIDYSGGDPITGTGGLQFNGGTQSALGGDGLSVTGGGSVSATYTPDAAVTGNGVIRVGTAGANHIVSGGDAIVFTGLEPVDITGMITATLVLPGADDVLTIANGTDFFAGNVNAALVVSGTSNLVPIETAAFWNNGHLVIDTTAVDGDDLVTVTGGDNAHANASLSILAGNGAEEIRITSAAVITTGDQTYEGVTTLDSAGNAVILNGTNVTFGSPTLASSLRSLVDGEETLTINASGVTTFHGPVGDNAQRLASLTTDAAGSTAINGGSITTTGAQTYNDAVTLNAAAPGNSTVLTASDVTFASTVRSTVDGEDALTVNATGATMFLGAVGDNSQRLASLTTDAAGSTAINGGSVNTTGDQTYNDAVTLDSSADTTTLTGSNISFASTLRSLTDGEESLVINGSGITAFAGAVGDGGQRFASITTDAAGSIAMNGGTIDTTTSQNYNDNIVLGTDTILTNSDTDANAADGQIALSGAVTVAAAAGMVSLTLNSDGNVSTVSVNLTEGAFRGNFTARMDADNDGIDTGTFGAITANDIDIRGSAACDETLVLNGPLNATGTVTLINIGSLTLNSAIQSTTSDITITVCNDIMLGAAGDITSVSGNVSLTADDNANGDGSITMADGAVIDAGSGTITLTASEDILLSSLTTTNATAAAVAVTSTAGSVLDNGDTDVDVNAVAGGVTISAANDIGTFGVGGMLLTTAPAALDAIETQSATLTLSAGGLIAVRETDDTIVTINSATSAFIHATGNIDASGSAPVTTDLALVADGNVTIGDVNVPGELRLEATDIVLNDATVGNNNAVMELAAQQILFKSATAENITVSPNAGTSVQLDAEITTAALNISITATQDVEIIDLDSDIDAIGLRTQNNGHSSVTAANGTITVSDRAVSSGPGMITMLAMAAPGSTANGITVNSTIQTDSGAINLTGTGGDTGSHNDGIQVQAAGVITSARGAISLTGTGGGDALSSDNHGVHLLPGATVSSTGLIAGNVTVTGTGGTGSGGGHHGVLVDNAAVTSVDGFITLNGTGGTGTAGNNAGVVLDSDAVVRSTGLATVQITGLGGEGAAGVDGIRILDTTIAGIGTVVESVTGSIQLDGTAGFVGTGGSGVGVLMNGTGSATIRSTGTIATDGSAAAITINATGGTGAAGQAGLLMMGTSQTITAVDGDIAVTGDAGSGIGTDNIGIDLQAGSTIVSTGTTVDAAAVLLSGSGSQVAATTNAGIHVHSAVTLTTAAGDLLLESRDTRSDIVVDANLTSASGHISLTAADDIDLNANVSTGAAGTIWMLASNQFVDGISGIDMQLGTTVTTAGGNMRLAADNSGDVLLSSLNANGGNVSIVAEGSVLDANAGSTNVQATTLRIWADAIVNADGSHDTAAAGDGTGSIGTFGSPEVTTNVNILAARSATGMNIRELNGVVIDNTGDLSVQQVHFNSTLTTVTDTNLSDLVTTNNGSIVLRAVAGTITLNDGTAPADGNAIVADGTGNVLVQTEALGTDIIVDADIRSTTGHITLMAVQNILLNANVDVVTAGAGSIVLDAGTGAVTMDATATLQTVDGSIRVKADQDITVGDITATNANVSLVSILGSILDADPDDTDIDITALGLRMNAAIGIGTPTNAIETSVNVITARAGSGGIHVIEANGIIVDDVTVTTQKVQNDASVLPIIDAIQSDLVTTNNGSIVLRALAGTITLNDGTAPADGNAIVADGTGNVLIQTEAAGTDIIVNADIRSTTGHITLMAVQNILLNANVDVVTAGAGSIVLDAGTGAVTMDATATLQTVDGSIRVKADQDITVGDITATNGNVSLVSILGSILDADPDDSDLDITASGLRMNAAIGIGTPTNAIETSVNVITARAGSGGIHVIEANGIIVDDVTVTTQKVQNDASELPIIDAIQSDLVTTNNGSIVLRALAGTITLNDGTAPADGNAVIADGTGNVLIQTEALGTDILVNADIRSTTGHITLMAVQNIVLNANVDVVTTGAGSIVLDAGTGAVTMDATATLQTVDGSIRVKADQDITVGDITATNGNVSLVSVLGSILDADPDDSDLDVTALGLRMNAAIGIGTPTNAIETSVNVITARAGSGGINIIEANGVIVDDVTVTTQKVQNDASVLPIIDAIQSDLVTTNNGSIVLRALAGTITLNDGTAPADGNAVVADGTGNVLIQTEAAGTDILVNADIRSTTGHITLMAVENIVLNANVDVVTTGAGSIVLDAGTGAVTMDATATLQTVDGSIRVKADQDITVGDITATNGNVSLVSVLGSILDADPDDTDIDITALGLRMNAAIGIGTPTNAIETSVNVITARAGSGGIHVIEANGIIVDDVTVTTRKVQNDASVLPIIDAIQSDLVTTNNGSIVLRALAGTITLNDGTAPADGNSVVADGTGNVLIQTEALGTDILVNADIRSTTGHITLMAVENIVLNANVGVVTTGSGSIVLDAGTGAVTMHPTATLQTVDGSIRVKADQDITVGDITATNANVSLVSTLGSILDADADDTDIDVTALGLRMNAAIGIGTPTNAIETSVNVITARAGSGGIHVIEANGIIVDDVTVTTQKVQNDASVLPIIDAIQSDLVTTNNGSIVLRALAGTITLNDGTAPADGNAIVADGTGNVLIQTEAAGTDIIVNADIRSTTGHITLMAVQNILLNANVDVVTAGAGSIVLDAGTGAVTMDATATLQTVDGSIRVKADQDITVGDITATNGNVSLVSILGSILDADPDDSDLDITASGLRMNAAIGIGTPTNAIETSVNVITARAGSGGIHVIEANGIIVDDVTVTTQKVQNDASELPIIDAIQSDLVTTNNGSIVLRALAGTITLNDGTAPADGNAVIADGTGNVLIQTEALGTDILVNADIRSTTGHITLMAVQNIVLNANVDVVTTGAGSIVLDAGTGAVTMDATATLQTVDGSIRVKADQDITVGDITATNGNVSLVSVLGSILDADPDDSDLDVTALGLRMNAAIGIGTPTNAIETSVNVITARAGSGGINIIEANGVIVDDVTVTTQKVQNDASVLPIIDAIQSDLVTTNNGSIVLRALAGTITLNDGTAPADGNAVVADGTGNVLIQTEAAGTDILVNADIRSTTGHITLMAVENIVLNANVDVVTTGAGSIVLDAGTGAVTMDATATLQTVDGSIRVKADQDITVGDITATNGNVSLVSVLGSILDADPDDTDIDITALGLRMNAAIGIGTPTNAIETSVNVITARAGSGGIHVIEANGIIVDDVTVTTRKVQNDASVLPIIDAIQSDLVTTNNGSIVLRALAGTITLNDGTAPADGNSVVADGTGNVLIQTEALGTDILVNADIRSTTGHITLMAVENIVLNANVGVVTTGSGSIVLDAGTGAVTMHPTATLQTVDGSIRVKADQDITVGDITATNANVSLVSTLGSILDADADDTDIDVTALGLRMNAAIGIGTPTNAIETSVNVITARAGSGGIHVIEANGIIVDDVTVTTQKVQNDASVLPIIDAIQSDLVTTNNGSIVLRALAGTITLNDGTAPADGNAIVADGTGNVLIQTEAAGTDIIVNADIRSTTGHITLMAVQNILLNANVDVVTAGAGSIVLDAGTGAVTMDATATLQTVDGSIRVKADQDITVGDITATNGNVSLVSILGSILDADPDDSDLDITASGLRMNAAIGIGTPTNAIETSVNVITARAGSGGIHVIEANGIIVDDVTVTTQKVQNDASELPIIDAIQSDLVTTNNGSIVLRALAGTITLNDGTAPADGNAVIADGTGNVLIQTEALGTDILVNADIRSTTGHITLMAVQNIVLNANVDVVTTGAGSIVLDAGTGAVTMDATATLQTVDGSIRVKADQDITVGDITATNGNVSLVSVLGSILDADPDDSDLDVTALGLRMNAAIGIGTPTNAIETSVNVITARAGSGGINIIEANGVIVDDVTVTTQKVQNDASVLPIIDAIQSDLVTTNNGSIVLRALAGTITLNDGTAPADGNAVVADGTGNVLIQTEAAGTDILVNADIRSTTGHITLMAVENIVLNANVDVVTTGAGSIVLDAGTGAVTMDATATLQTVDGSIRVKADQDITVGDITATNGNVSLVSVLGSILDADPDDTDIDITALGLRMNAAIGIGTPTNAIETSVNVITARAGSGGIHVIEANGIIVDDVTVTTRKVQNDASVLPIIDAIQSDLVTTNNGSIVLRALAGTITLNDGTAPADGNSVVADGTGNVLIQTEALGTDILVNADIRSTTGHITLMAVENIVLNANVGVVTTGSGSIVLDAGTGAVTMHPTATLQTVDGSIRVKADQDITVGDITATNANVSLVSTLGSILDADADDTDIDVTALGLRMNAAIGIGTPTNAIETSVNVITARAGSGGIHVIEANGIIVDDVTVTTQKVQNDASVLPIIDAIQSDLVTTNNGSIVLRALAGTITLNDGTAPADGNAIVADGTGNVLIQTEAAGTDIIVNADIRSTTGHITLMAVDDVLFNADVQTDGTSGPNSGSVLIIANNGTADGVGLDGVIMANDTSVTTHSGVIRILADNESDIVLGRLDTVDADFAAGAVTLLAERSILDGAGDLSELNIQTATLRMIADAALTNAANQSGQIGAADLANVNPDTNINAIDIQVMTLAAQSADGIYLSEADGLTVGATGSITVRQVNIDNTLTPATDASLSDLTTTNNGPIKLTSGGFITVDDGDVDGFGIQAHSTIDPNTTNSPGSILLQALTDVTINADINSGRGHVSLIAGGNVMQNADVLTDGTLNTTAPEGTVLVQAQNDVVMANGTVTRSLNGEIRVNAIAGSVVLGLVDTGNGTGAVSVLAGVDVLDQNTDFTDLNIQTDRLRIVADTGRIGAPGGQGIDTEAMTLAAMSATGIYVQELTDVTIGSTGDITVQRVNFNSTLTPVADLSLADLTTTNSGPIKLTSGGSIIVNDGNTDGIGVRAHSTVDPNGANSPGSVLLQAANNVTINSDVITWDGTIATNGDLNPGRGHISVVAGNNVVQNADILTDGTQEATDPEGTIHINAQNDVLMANGTLTRSLDGETRIEAGDGTVRLGLIDTGAGTGAVSISAGIDILDNNDTALNIQAGTLRMVADSNLDLSGTIGLPDDGPPSANVNAIDLRVDILAAQSFSGIFVLAENSLTIDATGDITVQQVNFDSTLTSVMNASLSDLTTTSGAIEVVVSTGTLTVNSGSNSGTDGVLIKGSGDILLETLEMSGHIEVNADIRATDLDGRADLTFADDEQIVIRTADHGDLTGQVKMADGVTITTDDAPSADIQSGSGNSVNVSTPEEAQQFRVGSQVTVVYRSASGEISSERFSVTGVGGATITLNDSITSGLTPIRLLNEFTDTAQTSFALTSVNSPTSITINLPALSTFFTDPGGASADSSSNAGRIVTIVDGDSAPETFLIRDVSGDTITLDHAMRGTFSSGATVLISEGSPVSLRGSALAGSNQIVLDDISGFAVGSTIRLATTVTPSDLSTAQVVQEVFVVTARDTGSGTLTLDRTLVHDFANDTTHPAFAVLEVGDRITLSAGDGTGEVSFGENITISTDYGVARQFTYRPTGLADTGGDNTAFFFNDAPIKGQLVSARPQEFLATFTLQVGQLNEENLRLDFDWRDPENGQRAEIQAGELNDDELITSQRYQLLRLDVGNALYDLAHTYTLDELVNLQEAIDNTRFIVDFAVAHHESITVRGAILPDTPVDVPPVTLVDEVVAGGRVSATDDVTTGQNPYRVSLAENLDDADLIFEPGEVEFVIPSGFPVGFFAKVLPPELVAPQVFVQEPTTPIFAQFIQQVQSVSSFSTAKGTEVYFQVVRDWFDPDDPRQTIEDRIPQSEFNTVENLEDLISEEPEKYPDGTGYKVILVIETGSGSIRRPVLEFEISGGLPGVISNDLPDDPDDMKLEVIENPERAPLLSDPESEPEPSDTDGPAARLDNVGSVHAVSANMPTSHLVSPYTDVSSSSVSPDTTSEDTQAADLSAAGTIGLGILASRRLAAFRNNLRRPQPSASLSRAARTLRQLRNQGEEA
ncbi:MAG: Calx-beta domain-containing protein [Planctomycetaceae bacterium]